MHFVLRDHKLYLTCFLRSLNPYWVWVYDHFFLTLLLEFGASYLQVDVGAITYISSCLVASPSDIPLMQQALAESEMPALEMPAFAKGAQWSDLEELSTLEKVLRSNLEATDPESLSELAWQKAVEAKSLWCSELLQALAYTYLARRTKKVPLLPFRCPTWAQAFAERAAMSTR